MKTNNVKENNLSQPADWYGKAGKMTRYWLTVFFIILLSGIPSFAQNSNVNWYSFSNRFGSSGSANYTTVSSTGQSFIGNSSNEQSKIISGFLTHRDNSVTGISNAKNTIPDIFELKQNYPNPFNPPRTIKHSIPSSEFVTLKIYDVLGNEIAISVDEEKPAGNYRVEFDAKHLASGVYYYKLQSGKVNEIKKMLLIK